MALDKPKKGSLKTLEGVFLQGIRFQRHGIFKKIRGLQSVSKNAIGSWFLRRKAMKREGVLVPIVMAFSPTMRCNLSCIGCYSRDYPRDNELTLSTIDEMLKSAEELGVFLFVITGGEPLLREGILDTLQAHRKLLFLMITNGTLMDAEKARMISQARNIVTVVSIEGTEEQTNIRRGQNVYQKAVEAMELLQNAGATFGFSAMVTRENYVALSSDQFVDNMVSRCCVLGFYTEYIPIGSDAQWELVLEDEERTYFRERILDLRQNKPIMAVHLPDDEYGTNNKCLGVVGGSVHINSRGDVEPCPFAHFAIDNVKEKSLKEVFMSDFMTEIRFSEAVVRHGKLGCALFENRDMLKDIAIKTGAKATDLKHER